MVVELAVVTSDLSEEAIRLAVEGQLNNMLMNDVCQLHCGIFLGKPVSRCRYGLFVK